MTDHNRIQNEKWLEQKIYQKKKIELFEIRDKVNIKRTFTYKKATNEK